jgi:hypothetical protein
METKATIMLISSRKLTAEAEVSNLWDIRLGTGLLPVLWSHR